MLVRVRIIGALFDFEDHGVFFSDDHAVPDAGLDVDEWRVFVEQVAGKNVATFAEDEEFELSGNEGKGFGRVWLWVTVGLNVGARLHEVEQALDACFLAALDGKDDAKTWAFPGGFFAERECVFVECEN